MAVPADQQHTMKASLETLPIELVECIVTLLDLRDIASLRLTSCSIESKASQGHFAALFHRREFALNRSTLQKMVQMTSQGRPGCLLQHCTISGVVGTDGTAGSEFDEHVRLLTEAFRNLKQLSPRGGLASLRLDVDVRGRNPRDVFWIRDFRLWTDICTMALHTFNLTMKALNESQLPVGELNLFIGTLPRTGCRLAYDALLSLLGEFTQCEVSDA
ncbi:hypothetical protein F4809DRAFT_638639 [Biscogniauxia mediterranea]|nr:hypothetical protein F4809DRAFT_638639 [Biscogniauxia mediterranea]